MDIVAALLRPVTLPSTGMALAAHRAARNAHGSITSVRDPISGGDDDGVEPVASLQLSTSVRSMTAWTCRRRRQHHVAVDSRNRAGDELADLELVVLKEAASASAKLCCSVVGFVSSVISIAARLARRSHGLSPFG